MLTSIIMIKKNERVFSLQCCAVYAVTKKIKIKILQNSFVCNTLIPVYHCHKPVFRHKIFRRAGMREGGLPLPLANHYLIFIILRACDLNLVMISLLASKYQDFKLRDLQFHFIKQLKNNFNDLLF